MIGTLVWQRRAFAHGPDELTISAEYDHEPPTTNYQPLTTNHHARPSFFVFAQSETGVPLRTLLDALRRAGFPVGIGMEIAGDAIDAQLDDPLWETAFVRWQEPELHDVWLLERAVVGTDEEADHAHHGRLALCQ